MNTLAEAKQYLRDNWEDGVDCPCCGQLVKKYRIKINYFMCHFLINLYKLNKTKEFAHLNEIVEGKKTSGLYGYVCMWKLAEKAPNDDPAKKNSGLWKITKMGELFVEGRIAIKTYCFVYDNKCLGFDGEEITIQEALGNKFNYTELMAS